MYSSASYASALIYTSLEDKQFSIAIFIDLSKAFDTVNHDILLEKLYFYGIRGQVYTWFKSYLSNRSQKTSLMIKYPKQHLLIVEYHKDLYLVQFCF